MKEVRRTEAEIHNLKKIIDHKQSLGEFKVQKNKRLFERMLKREGFPNLQNFKSLKEDCMV